MRKRVFAAALLFWTGLAFCGDLFFIERGDTVFLTPAQPQRAARTTGGGQAESGDYESDGWFTTQHGNRVKIAAGVLVELENGASAESVFALASVKSYEELAPNIFLVIPENDSEQFELSRELLRNPRVLHSHPNLIRERRPR